MEPNSTSVAARPWMLLNPNAGAGAFMADMTALAAENGCACELPSGLPQAIDAVRKAVESGHTRVIVGGGDGSISRIVNVLAEIDTPVELGIIPLGTANDLARSLDLPRSDPAAAFELALRGSARPVDVVRITGGVRAASINVCVSGFGGEIGALLEEERKERWGGLAYWLAAAGHLADPASYEVRVAVDGEVIETRAFGVSVANGRYVGGGFPIAPDALLDDGLVEVAVIPEQPLLKALAAGLDLVTNRHHDSELLYALRGRRVEVSAAPPMPFSLDGESAGEIDAVFEVLPGRLRVVAGPKPPAFRQIEASS